MKKKLLLSLIVIALFGVYACGGSGGSDDSSGGTGSSDFSQATSASVTGVTTDDDFATNGKFTVGFVAQDSEGNAILVDESDASSLIKGKNWITLRYATEEGTTTSLDCAIDTPDSSTCTLSDVSSTTPRATDVFGVALIDDSGSMASSDSDKDRDPATDAFLDSICASTSNYFGVFDFGAGSNLDFDDTRDLLTADGSELSGLPFLDCSSDNVTEAKTAIENQVDYSSDTPLYTSLAEVCESIAEAVGSGGDQAGLSPAILLLSDGRPNSATEEVITGATDCITDNDVTLCTVGLGEGSETYVNDEGYYKCSCTEDSECYSGTCTDGYCVTTTECDTDFDCFTYGYGTCSDDGVCRDYGCGAIDVLKYLAEVGNCTYASATDASALESIFDAIGMAVSSGQNFAVFAISPVPASGTTVEGTLTVGTATATFSFVAP